MSDLISRKAVLKQIGKIRQGAQMMDDIRRASIIMNGMDLCEEAVRNQPSAQSERKKGKCIEQDDGWDGVYYECSCCKEAFTLMDGTPTDNLYNYCPNCGADMRGDQNED